MIGRLVLWGGDPYLDVQFGSLRDRVEQGDDTLREAALNAYRAACDGDDAFAQVDAAYTLTIARHNDRVAGLNRTLGEIRAEDAVEGVREGTAAS